MSNITDFLPPIYDLRGKVLDKEVEFFLSASEHRKTAVWSF